MSQNSKPNHVDDPKVVESQMALIRKGHAAELEIEFGGFKVPCRILPLETEIQLMATARLNAKKAPAHVLDDPEIYEMKKAELLQKEILFSALTIGSTHHISRKTLDKLSGDELAKMYDAYRSVVKMSDPKFEELDYNRIDDMIQQVKKKNASPSAFYISDLVAMGRYFLEQIQRQGNAHGS